MAKPFIPLILGTGRRGRESEKVAKFVYSRMQKMNIRTEYIDVRKLANSFTVAAWSKHKKADEWRKIAKRAHGFFIVSPEYNHGYPGELKILFDYAFDEYYGKPVGICAVSSGGFGGARMVENLLPVLIAFAMRPADGTIYVSNVQETFKKSDSELNKLYHEKISGLVNNIISMVN